MPNLEPAPDSVENTYSNPVVLPMFESSMRFQEFRDMRWLDTILSLDSRMAWIRLDFPEAFAPYMAENVRMSRPCDSITWSGWILDLPATIDSFLSSPNER